MPHAFKIISHLETAVIIVDGKIAYPPRFRKITVIHHERDAHKTSQLFVILPAKSHEYQSFHIPHGGKADNLVYIFRHLNHHKKSGLFNFSGQAIQGGGNKNVLKGMGFVFFMVVYHNADNTGIVLGEQNPGHAWNILPFL